MGVGGGHRLFDVERVYHEHADVDFSEFVAQRPAMDDSMLAELIEADGRIRVELGRSVELNRYLRAVPDLRERTEPLDAAIDVTIRSMAAFGVPKQDAQRQLIANYPDLERVIREAGALDEAMLATSQLRARIRGGPDRALPAEFGPLLPDGRARYRLLELIGRGTGGEVYRAVDCLLSETGHEALVAVKVLNTGNPGLWGRERFIEEATKARRVNHPNVVRVMDRGVSERDEEFIVYEYVAGGDLHSWVEAHPELSLAEVVRLVAGIARGVQAAHGAGLVHCDLKPGNIVLSPEGEPKVADFGVAVRRDPWMTEDRGASAGGRIGNVAFISPEQYRMEPGALVPGSDIFAIGGMLYWLLTRRLPNGETLTEIEHTHDPADGRKKAPSVRAVRREIDRDLNAICARCLAPRPQDRYQSAVQVADDLEAWLRHEAIQWTSPSVVHKFRLWARRKPSLAITYAVMFAVIVGAGAWIWRVSAEATAQRLGTAIAKARMDRGNDAARQVRGQVALMLEAWRPLAKVEPWAFLPLIPYIEWVLGHGVLGDPQSETPPWRHRLVILERMFEESRDIHGSDALSTLCLESTLAFWLVVEYRADEAAPIIAANREAWLRVLPPEQTWHDWLTALSECAAAQVMAARAARPLSSADRDRLAAAASSLRGIYDSIGPGSTETQFKVLIRRTLTELYGPDLLNQPEHLAFGKPR